MTDEQRRRYIHYAQASQHLRAAATLLAEHEPELARRLNVDADCMYAEAAPLIGAPPAAAKPKGERHETDR